MVYIGGYGLVKMTGILLLTYKISEKFSKNNFTYQI